jgi:membrane fusion protein (multidrug efflux system)
MDQQKQPRPEAGGASPGDATGQAPPPPPNGGGPARNANGKRLKLLVILAVLAVILAGGLGYYWWSRDRVSTSDAFVDGHIYPITPRVGGYVVQVLVDDNQQVQAGDTLLVLDPTDYEVAVASAEAALAEAEATLKSLEQGVPLELSQTQQRVRGAKAELASLRNNLAAADGQVRAATQELERTAAVKRLATLRLERIKVLREKKAVAQASLDEAEANFQTAQAQDRGARDRQAAAIKQRDALHSDLEKAEAAIALAATGHDLAGIKASQVLAQQGRVKLAKARLRQARLNLEYTKIKAPIHGLISKKNVEPGQVVGQGQPLMAVVPLDYADLWITANFKETDLTRIKVGQPVKIAIDTYPGLKLKGRVNSLMSGTGAAFSLFPPENATGNYVKVVQRIPVKITIDTDQGPEHPILRVGMSAVPTVFLDR